MRGWRLGWGALALLLGGCPAVASDPPPPTRQPEIPSAPPHALGALAAGTDAAPHPDAAALGDDVAPDVPVPPPSGPPDAGAPVPAAPVPPAPAAPDAGMAL